MIKSSDDLKKHMKKKPAKKNKVKTVLYSVGTVVILILVFQIISDMSLVPDESEVSQAISDQYNNNKDQAEPDASWSTEALEETEKPEETEYLVEQGTLDAKQDTESPADTGTTANYEDQAGKEKDTSVKTGVLEAKDSTLVVGSQTEQDVSGALGDQAVLNIEIEDQTTPELPEDSAGQATPELPAGTDDQEAPSGGNEGQASQDDAIEPGVGTENEIPLEGELSCH